MARSQPTPREQAANTDRWTEILLRALSNRVAKRWRFVSFRGLGGGEWRGIVDVLGVRKNTGLFEHRVLMAGDLLDVVLIQMKGGSEKPDIRRPREVKRHYRARQIILFWWKRKK